MMFSEVPVNLRQEVQDLLNNYALDGSDLANQLVKLLTNYTGNKSPSCTVEEITSAGAKQIRHMKNEVSNISSGFTNFDEAFGGLKLGELVMLASRPSLGKTQLVLNIVSRVSKSTPTALFTIDENLNTHLQRLLALNGKFEVKSVTTIQPEEPSHSDFEYSCIDFLNNQLYMGNYGYAFYDFEIQLRRLIKSKGLKLVVLDDLYLNTFSDFRRNLKDNHFRLLYWALKKIAYQENVCIITTHSVKQVADERGGLKIPMLNDIDSCDSIDDLANKIGLLYDGNYYGAAEFFAEEFQGEDKLFLLMLKNCSGVRKGLTFSSNAYQELLAFGSFELTEFPN